MDVLIITHCHSVLGESQSSAVGCSYSLIPHNIYVPNGSCCNMKY